VSWLVRRLRRNERGAAIVEMALVAPVLILFLIGSLQVGLVVIGNATASNAAREGARAASIRYECADNHVSTRCTANPSTNYTFIKNAVMAKLAGLVQQSSIQVSVVCRAGSATGSVVTCEKGYVTPDTDVVEVTVRWRHIGATPYIADSLHTSVARSVINGRPDLTLLAPEADTTPPSLISAVLKDNDHDGISRTIELTFSEALTQTVTAAPFTVANSVTGSNTISTATISNRVVTLSMAGSSTGTAPGAMTVALAASSGGVTDAWGNQASFGPTTLTDLASPVLLSAVDTSGLLNGYPEAGDKITLTFTEPIATALGSPTIDYYRPQSGNVTFNIAGVTAGPLTTSTQNYVTTKNSTVTLQALTTKSGNTIVVTITSPIVCSPIGCGLLAAVINESPAWSFVPATTLADAAGNLVAGTSPTIQNIF
jgi:Flp pilus assembly protein TadG